MQGRLSPESLSRAFHELQARDASGTLYVRDESSTRQIAFRHGRIVAAESTDANFQLGEVLVRRRKLTVSELHRARLAAEHSGKNLATVLGELDILSAAAIEVELVRLSRGIVDALFKLHHGEFRFDETAAVSAQHGVALDLAPVDVANEALFHAEQQLRGQLHWLPGPEQGVPYAESTLSTKHSVLVDLLKERFRPGLTMADVLEISTLSREETLEGLEALIAAGILDVRTNEDLRTDTEPNPVPSTGATPSAPAPPGTLGRFKVERVIGRGSMGAVLLAQDPAIDRTVAIKLVQTAIHLPPSKQEKYIERFYREASAAGQLIHPNIVTVFDVGHADDDTPFIVMEYVEGKTLSEVLENETLSFAQAFQIAHDVLSGLSYAHSQGIVHRDIKPGNIMVTRDYRGKIMDFGIAHVAGSELTTDDDLLGSPYYMAPEQLSKGKIDARTDLFSFAVVLYRMLTGKLPFDGDSFAAIAQSILHDEPIPPAEQNPSVTPGVSSIILRCLEKISDDRYDGAEDVDQALQAARASTSSNAVTRQVRRTVEVGRDHWLSISFALIVGALFVFGLALTVERQAAPNDPEPPASSVAPPPVHEPEPIEPIATLEPPGQREPPRPTSTAPPPRPRRQVAPRPRPPRPAPESSPTESATSSSPHTDPSRPTRADLFFEAQMALERGELEASRSWLEELLLKDPTFDGASDLLTEVTDLLWAEGLPLTFSARHRHRLGGCEGELNLTTLGVRFVSDDHDWAWSQDEIRVLERSDDGTFTVETYEKDLIGLGKNKRYRFELDGGLSAADWARYERVAR